MTAVAGIAGRDATTARVCPTGGWLELESSPPARHPLLGETALALLERGARLEGLAKLAHRPGDPTPCLRAELPLDAEADLGWRLRETWAGFATALGLESAPRRGGDCGLASLDPAPVGGAACDEVDAAALPDLCRASGWPAFERAPGRMTVDLELDDVVARAQIEADGPAAEVRVAAELDFLPIALPRICARAVARFLLESASVVRLVRPFAARGERWLRLGFEARYAARPPRPCELGHALAALSVACRLSGREIAALGRDQALACAYLALREPGAASDRAATSAPQASRIDAPIHGEQGEER